MAFTLGARTAGHAYGRVGGSGLLACHFYVPLLLVGASLLIGAWRIHTTVVVARDSVTYIEMAQQLASEPLAAVQRRPVGFPAMILLVHRAMTAIVERPGVEGWILAGQVASLLSQMLAVVVLYYLGRHLVGPVHSAWGILILLLLPLPARMAGDVLRDWPNVFLLSMGFLLLLRAPLGRVWWYGLAGLVAGLAGLVRTEAVQLVVYGLGWLVWSGVWGEGREMRRRLAACGMVLVAAYLAVQGPYLVARTSNVPYELEVIFPDRIQGAAAAGGEAWTSDLASRQVKVAAEAGAGGGLPAAVGADLAPPLDIANEIFQETGELLLWVHLPALLVGLVYRQRRGAGPRERFFFRALIAVNLALLVSRYFLVGPQISARYVLPAVALLHFYIPVGWQMIGAAAERRFGRDGTRSRGAESACPGWNRAGVVLMVLAMAVCLPKLLAPYRQEKKALRSAASWLREHSPTGVRVASEERLVNLYADRPVGTNQTGFGYVVRILEPDDKRAVPRGWVVVFEESIGRPARGERLVIYRAPP